MTTTRDALKLAQAALNSADRLLGEFDEDNRWREFDRNIALAAIDAALAQKAEPVAHEPVITNEMVLVAREVVWNHGEVVPRTHTMAEALYAAMRAAPPQRRIKVEKIPPRRLPDDDAQAG